MSQSDIERFVADLKSDSSLLDGLKGQAAGLASVVDYAKGKGYDVTIEEAKSYVSDQAGQDLSDDQLDAVAGGKGHHRSHTATHTTTQQTAVTSTTELVNAETTTEAAAEVEVAAVAGVVIVVT